MSGISLSAGTLSKALSSAASVVEVVRHIPILEAVLLRCSGGELEILASDLDVEFRQVLPVEAGEISAAVPAHRFAAMCGSCPPDATIRLEVEAGRLLVKCGRSRWSMPLIPHDDFPSMPVESLCEPVQFAGKALADALARTHPFVASEITKRYIGGVLLEPEQGCARLVGMDGLRGVVVTTQTPYPSGAPTVMIGAKFARTAEKHVADSETVTVAWDERKIRVCAGPVTLTGKLLDETYPDYRRALPEPGNNPITLDPLALRSGLKRVSLVETGKTRVVVFEASDDKVTLSLSDLAGGSGHEEILASFEGEHRVGFNATFADSVLTAIGGETIEIHQEAERCAIFRRTVPDGAWGFVMNVRV